MAWVAGDRNVCGSTPGTTTSTVRQTPCNAARWSFALNATTIARTIVALTTDKDARTRECFVIESSLDASLHCDARALKRHQAPASRWRLMAHCWAMLS